MISRKLGILFVITRKWNEMDKNAYRKSETNRISKKFCQVKLAGN